MVRVISEKSFELKINEDGVSFAFGSGPFILVDDMTHVEAQEAARTLAEQMQFLTMLPHSREFREQKQITVVWRGWAYRLLASNWLIATAWLFLAGVMPRIHLPIFVGASFGLAVGTLFVSLPGWIAVRRLSSGA